MAAMTETLNFTAMRQAMVSSQLRPNAVDDPRVVAAMALVPRERFMPATIAPLAYRDTALALGEGRMANLPLASGRLLTEARLQRGDRVLLIGAATGYVAAVLAELVASVVAVESAPALVAVACALLEGSTSIEIVEGPLEAGHVAGAPYDVLIVDGAIERLPDELIAQVRVGGRIVSGIVERGVTRLARGTRSEGGFGLVDFADVDCIVLPGFAAPRRFNF